MIDMMKNKVLTPTAIASFKTMYNQEMECVSFTFARQGPTIEASYFLKQNFMEKQTIRKADPEKVSKLP